MQFDKIKIGNTTISPAFFCAPMAGVTHSAFRRCISEIGGYGALYTEMLSGNAILSENTSVSPYTKKRACEGSVIYQLLLNGDENIPAVIERLKPLEPAGIDCNLGCPAPEIRKCKSGATLFEDIERMKTVLSVMRKSWNGALTVKCRLGKESDNWQERFHQRIKAIESCGVDTITVHPRFFHEKLRRKARWKLFPWISSITKLPVIANGDITCPEDISCHSSDFASVNGIMVGRMAVVQPWIFRLINGESHDVNYHGLWQNLCRYVEEDFIPEKVLGRMKEFTAYFSRNFFFGHSLFTAVQRSKSIEEAKKEVELFFQKDQKIVRKPNIQGI